MAATHNAKSMMRALQLAKPHSISLTTLPKPTAPAGHLLIKVHASAIQPSDIANSNGGFGETTFPRVPGRDFSGVVESIGDGVSPDLVGKEVFGTSGNKLAFTVDGFQAQYAVVTAESITTKPKALTHEQAATLGVPFSTAALIVRRAQIKEGERVLVIGANGAVGSAVCALLEEKVIKAIRGGGDVDTAKDPSLESAGTVDVAIDTVGIPALVEAAIDRLAPGGRLVFISAPKDQPTPTMTIKMKDFYREEKALLGVNSVLKTVEEMATLLSQVDERILVEYAKAHSNWTTVGLDDAVNAYGDKTKGKKYVIKL